jgi:cell division protein FtsB
MKEKQKRIKEAQEKIEKQKREISKLEETKIKLNDNIARLEREERDRRHDFDESIKKKS